MNATRRPAHEHAGIPVSRIVEAIAVKGDQAKESIRCLRPRLSRSNQHNRGTQHRGRSIP